MLLSACLLDARASCLRQPLAYTTTSFACVGVAGQGLTNFSMRVCVLKLIKTIYSLLLFEEIVCLEAAAKWKCCAGSN